ncbi:MAG TPA: FAD:protein FMN transferase [Solirubrobacterales bacterium]|nr:FAD:protein FMN transferase [Solirubrobacterales bacterium]
MNPEAHLQFACFGGVASIHVRDSDEEQGRRLAERGRELLLDAHRRLSRFEPASELSRLNRDPRTAVPASPLLRKLAAAVLTAGMRSGGLVDATLLDAIERAGYRSSLDAAKPPPPRAALAARNQAPARASAAAGWSAVSVDAQAGTVIRPPGVRIDGGGIAKGLLADLVGAELAATEAFAVECCGDVRLGGSSALRRRIKVDDPFGAEPLHEFEIRTGAVATSGITRRSWEEGGASLAHQILDPASGRPAFTGIVQATALAPTALEAEILAKSALLSGPEAAEGWLPFGGVLVPVVGEAEVIAGAQSLAGAVAA